MVLLAALSLAAVAQLPIGPVAPAGANQSFQQAVLVVEDLLEKSDFDGAKRAISILPNPSFKLEWDDANVPETLRPHLATMRESAMDEWRILLRESKMTSVASGGDLKISFAPLLKDAEGNPIGATQSFSTKVGEPRTHVVIALQRGNPSQPTTATEVRNEVMFGIATYLGIERTHYPGAASFRTDLPGAGQARVSQSDVSVGSRLLPVVEKLRELVEKRVAVQAARPKLSLESTKIVLPKAVQAEPVRFTIKVTNSGNAPLFYRFTPDCGCLSANHTPMIEAGQTAEVVAFVDTVNFVGELRHKFYIFANDAAEPRRELPVDIDVEPLFRFHRDGPTVLQSTDQGADTEVILLLSDAAKFSVTDSRVQGLKGTVAMSPWEGEFGTPPVKGKGYRFKVHLDRTSIPGRALANLEISTDSLVFPLLRYSIYAQKGIIAVPESLYLGEVSQAPTLSSFVLSRPGFPFKVRAIQSNVPYLKAAATPLQDGSEHRVTVTYDGKADFGPIGAMLTVFTDDPKQPKVLVPVVGSVR